MKKQKKAEKQAALEAAKAANGDLAGNESGGKNWNRLNQFSVGINLLDRDEKSINDHVNVNVLMCFVVAVFFSNLINFDLNFNQI